MEDQGNLLFPAFFKLDKLQTLIVGAGAVGLEKMSMMFRHAPNAVVKVVAPEIRPEILELASLHATIQLVQKPFDVVDLEGVDLVICATADRSLNEAVWKEAKAKKILVNVADTPDLCDFYLSAVVKKGHLKVAISTNGKSPTLAKRMRELLEDVLPEEIDELLSNLEGLRAQLKGDFEEKVEKLNEITKTFSEKK